MSSLSKIGETYFTGGNSPAPLGELPPSCRRGRRANAVRTWLACLMSMIAAVLCTPWRARAATVIATFTGTVTSGTDYTGVFVGKRADLTGYYYSLILMIDDMGGMPTGNLSSCNNGRDSLDGDGVDTPVPKGVLTINGKSYTLGTYTPFSTSSWVTTGIETSPQMSLGFAIRDSMTADTAPVEGEEIIFGSINLNSTQVCRTWFSPFSYTLVPSKDSGGFLYLVDLRDPNNSQQVVGFGEGGLSIQTVTVSGPIATPHIFYLDPSTGTYSDVTNSMGVPVVVGEQIQLLALPADSAKGKHWSVPGKPIVGYTAMVCGTKDTPPCGPGSVTPVTPEDLSNPAMTKFYWYLPGTYTVKYSSGAAGKAETTFYVAPAPVPTVKANEKMAGESCEEYPEDCDIFYGPDNHLYMGFGRGLDTGNSGILFDEYGSPDSGRFEWVQLLKTDKITYTTTDGSKLKCPASPGLDGRYPAYYDETAEDSPGVGIASSFTAVNSNFSAQMYLLWTSNIPNSIPVPLGSTTWGFVESSKVEPTAINGWATPAVTARPGMFSPTEPEYPIWSSVAAPNKSPNCPGGSP